MTKQHIAEAARTKVAYVFPGQGSQWVGMGRELYQKSESVKTIFKKADDVLGFPLTKLCFEGPEAQLRQTINAQPAILTVSVAYLSFYSNNGASPADLVAGHSLGEYTALVAAKVLDFADAVNLVRQRATLMHQAGRQVPGGMAAIIGLDEFSLEEICQETGTEIANTNCSGQCVISGTRVSLARAMDLALARGARRAIPLDVSGAFHSSLMQPALKEMGEIISALSLRDPMIPIVANTTALPLTSATEIKTELIKQLCNCVRWQRSVEYMVHAGISTFVEIGPGRVLSGLIKRINKDAQIISTDDGTPR